MHTTQDPVPVSVAYQDGKDIYTKMCLYMYLRGQSNMKIQERAISIVSIPLEPSTTLHKRASPCNWAARCNLTLELKLLAREPADAVRINRPAT